PMGINFGTSATIIANHAIQNPIATFQCVRYFETDSRGTPRTFPVENERFSKIPLGKFRIIPGMPIAYWVTDAFRKAFSADPLSTLLVTRLGMSTANNDRFLRLWTEVSFSQ